MSAYTHHIFTSSTFSHYFIMLDKHGIARRIAQEVQNNSYVNLGIGIPTLVANYLPAGINV